MQVWDRGRICWNDRTAYTRLWEWERHTFMFKPFYGSVCCRAYAQEFFTLFANNLLSTNRVFCADGTVEMNLIEGINERLTPTNFVGVSRIMCRFVGGCVGGWAALTVTHRYAQKQKEWEKTQRQHERVQELMHTYKQHECGIWKLSAHQIKNIMRWHTGEKKGKKTTPVNSPVHRMSDGNVSGEPLRWGLSRSDRFWDRSLAREEVYVKERGQGVRRAPACSRKWIVTAGYNTWNAPAHLAFWLQKFNLVRSQVLTSLSCKSLRKYTGLKYEAH